ncbi:malate synthase G [Salipaludibacillus neizhouensis]|uniref:Malate synthase G n=1 Tax=Salipaludibacillus neizhouensis TaxID=885475 RepID=A0A3A9K7A9_9BACI|nr:malate synthase G [Salipaludibacillus neizhouensis]RKL65533.1 malate synthase G [Salipaludibacillus neizhouensis]
MPNHVKIKKLQVAEELYDFINSKVIPDSQVTSEEFWEGFGSLVTDLAPKNKALLNKREEIQTKIHTWNKENHDYSFDAYKEFLTDIGYLETEVSDFEITTENVDDEVAIQAGPQLVVPVNNGRYAINAANARWGSLYDALYGTDVISEENGAKKINAYNPIRGEKVIEYAKSFLDDTVPLKVGSHKDAVNYTIINEELSVELSNGKTTRILDATKFVGYKGTAGEPTALLLKNHDLHFEIQIDSTHPIGKSDSAHVKDILVESAITTIMDCEDSVAAVDAEDKVLVYSNWLGLMKGDLSTSFKKGNKTITRTLNPDREYKSPGDKAFTLSGRSLMFVRNVGHLMTSNAVLDENGNEVPEGFLDCMITSLIGKHTLLRNGTYQNSSKGSIYIVKPKMHGSEEVDFANELFDRVEDILGLERNTVKIGVMDEERRTSLNLKNCIHAVKERIVFINTGFLDRTGDEMHTSMESGPMIRKKDMKSSTWLNGYEKSNVMVGLSVGLRGKAQIGKGMWAMPELMADMIQQKGSQLHAGANTAWVPSPTAATLHALHYHQIHVKNVQQEIASNKVDFKDDILQVPVAENPNWSVEEIQAELDNNAQGILGYVVRWIELGIGCSKVPDINNVGLMEDRATLRISSQHMANWLHHDICTEEQLMEILKRMAKVVDEQNAGDPEYVPMAPDYDNSISFQAACDLVFQGYDQPSGYTEPILHRRRIEAKAKSKIKQS